MYQYMAVCRALRHGWGVAGVAPQGVLVRRDAGAYHVTLLVFQDGTVVVRDKWPDFLGKGG